MRFILLCCFLIAVSSCSDSNTNFSIVSSESENGFEIQEVHLQGHNIKTDNLFGLIKDVRYSDNSLYILDSSSENVISKLDLKNNKLTPLIQKGEGPNEIENGDIVKINRVENGRIEYHEFYNPYINFVDERNPLSVIEGNRLPDEFINAQASIGLTDQSVALVGSSESNTIDIIKNGERSIIALPDYFDFGRELSVDEKSIVMPKNVRSSDRHLLIWRNQFNRLEIINKDGTPFKNYSFGKNENITKDGLGRQFLYYFDAKIEGKYVYAMYGGFDMLDNFTESQIPFLKSELHVFNLETDDILRFKFDRLINYCTIDFDRNIIYAVEEDNEAQPLVKYNFELNI